MFDAAIKHTFPETVAFLAMTGPYDQLPAGLERLYHWIAASDLSPAGMPQAVFLTPQEQGPEVDAQWEIWTPVMGDAREFGPDKTGLGIKRVDAMTVATAMHQGPYESLCETYDALIEWVAEQGYRVSGPPIEIYYSDPEEVSPEDYLTEVQFPVDKA